MLIDGYEIVSRSEFENILENVASYDGGGSDDEGSSEKDDAGDDEEKPKAKGGKPKGKPKAEESSDDEGGDEESDEGSEEGASAEDAGAWYSTGYAESDKVSDREAAGGDNKAWRFFLNAGQETEVVILDSGEADKKKWDRKVCAPFNVWEHGFAVVNPDDPEDLTFYDVTCVRGRLDKTGKPRRCYICEKRKKIARKFHSMFTVLSKYEGRKGEAWSKKLLPANKKLLKTLKRRERKGGMFGMKFNVFRSDKQSARVGDDWSYDSTLTEDEVQELLGERQDLSPLDYVDECRPMTWEELENLLKDAILSDPKKAGKKSKRRASRDDDDDRPKGRGRSNDDDGEKEDRPRRRARDDEKDDDDSDEKPARRRSSRDEEKDDDEKPRRRSSKEDDDDEEGEESGDETSEETPAADEKAEPAQAAGDAGDDIPF